MSGDTIANDTERCRLEPVWGCKRQVSGLCTRFLGAQALSRAPTQVDGSFGGQLFQCNAVRSAIQKAA